MNNVTPVPSCLADSSEALTELSAAAPNSSLTTNEAYRKIRRSATTIGLAISMSAAGMLLPNQKHSVMALEGLPNESTTSTHEASSPMASDRKNSQPQLAYASKLDKVKLAPPAIKHEVKAGESLWQLSEEYQVSPEKIAGSNHINPQSDLFVGQSLKIPSVDRLVIEDQNASKGDSPSSSKIASAELDRSLDNLRRTRKNLENSLSELRPQEVAAKSEAIEVAAEVSEAIQKSQTISPETASANRLKTAVTPSPQTQEFASLEIPSLAEIKAKNSVSFDRDPLTADHFSNSDRSNSNPIALTTPQATEDNDVPVSESVSIPKLEPIDAASTPKTESPALSATEESTIADRGLDWQNVAKSNAIEQPKPFSIPSSSLPPIEAPQAQSQPSDSGQAYRVRVGDTLNSIARRHGISVAELIRTNKIVNPNLIKVNQQLLLPKTASASQPVATPVAIADDTFQENSTTANSGVMIASSDPTVIGNITPTPTSEATSNATQKTIEISVESPAVSYTEKLKADIEDLQQQYDREKPLNSAIALEEASDRSNTSLVGSQPINPEWSKERGITQPVASLTSSETQKVSVPSQPQGQLVGAAPSSASQYNDALQVPVGATVSPSLPALSAPDDYLPDPPMRFTGYIWPAKGVLTSGYGWRWGRMHKGVDIAAPIGTPILAAAPGEVISAGWNSGGYGNLVKVQHSDGSITLYAHNSRILVRKGQKVEQGEQIAAMGSTGYSTGPHLHFEIHPSGNGAVNPIAYLPGKRP